MRFLHWLRRRRPVAIVFCQQCQGAGPMLVVLDVRRVTEMLGQSCTRCHRTREAVEFPTEDEAFAFRRRAYIAAWGRAPVGH